MQTIQSNSEANKLGFLKSADSNPSVHIPAAGEPVYRDSIMRVQFGEWPGDAADGLLNADADAARDAMRELAGDEDLRAMKTLHGLAQTRFREMVATIAKVRDEEDPSLNHDGRLKIAASIVAPKLESLSATASGELARIDRVMAEVEAGIVQSMRTADPMDIAVQSDIRTHLRTLGGNLSIAAAAQALLDGDEMTMQAIATAPPRLSGLPGAGGPAHRIYTEIVEAVRARKAPEGTKRLQALRVGKAVAQQALQALDQSAHRLLDFDRARKLQELDAQRSAKLNVA